MKRANDELIWLKKERGSTMRMTALVALVARALVGLPRLLLLDEPLSNLEPDLRVALRGEVERLQHTLHLTSILVTHDRDDATALADRVVELRKGRA